MFGTYLGLGVILLIAIIGTAYFTWKDKKHSHDVE